jgi:hypothetical protein
MSILRKSLKMGIKICLLAENGPAALPPDRCRGLSLAPRRPNRSLRTREEIWPPMNAENADKKNNEVIGVHGVHRRLEFDFSPLLTLAARSRLRVCSHLPRPSWSG